MLIHFSARVSTSCCSHALSVQVNLSTRPEESVGSTEIWGRAESALKSALEQKVGLAETLCAMPTENGELVECPGPKSKS